MATVPPPHPSRHPRWVGLFSGSRAASVVYWLEDVAADFPRFVVEVADGIEIPPRAPREVGWPLDDPLLPLARRSARRFGSALRTGLAFCRVSEVGGA